MPANNFIRYNNAGPYYEYDSSVLQDGSGPWLELPLDASQVSSGVFNRARLGSGSGGAGNKYLADDSTWKTIDLSVLWPLHSIFIATVTTNPATLLGFGTWTAFAAGRVLVGFAAGDPDFGTGGATGGAKTHTLSSGEMPSHTHVQDAHTHTQNSHNHTQDAHRHSLFTPNAGGGNNQLATTGGDNSAGNNLSDGATCIQTTVATNQATTATNQNTTATNQNTGGGGAHNNLQPFIVVYMWERTA